MRTGAEWADVVPLRAPVDRRGSAYTPPDAWAFDTWATRDAAGRSVNGGTRNAIRNGTLSPLLAMAIDMDQPADTTRHLPLERLTSDHVWCGQVIRIPNEEAECLRNEV